jgi:hypothetical protein
MDGAGDPIYVEHDLPDCCFSNKSKVRVTVNRSCNPTGDHCCDDEINIDEECTFAGCSEIDGQPCALWEGETAGATFCGNAGWGVSYSSSVPVDVPPPDPHCPATGFTGSQSQNDCCGSSLTQTTTYTSGASETTSISVSVTNNEGCCAEVGAGCGSTSGGCDGACADEIAPP